MFRKVLLSGVAALGLVIPVATSAPAEAHEYHHWHHDRDRDRDRFEYDYVVLYRADCYSPWVYYGRFESEFRARRVMHELQERGYEVFMRMD
jgi:hypothetical protein